MTVELLYERDEIGECFSRSGARCSHDVAPCQRVGDGAALDLRHLGERTCAEPLECVLRQGQVCEVDLEFGMELFVLKDALFFLNIGKFVVVEVVARCRGLGSNALL